MAPSGSRRSAWKATNRRKKATTAGLTARAVPLPARALRPLARAVSGAGRAVLRPGLRRDISTEGLTEHNVFYGRHLPLGRSADPGHPAALTVLQTQLSLRHRGHFGADAAKRPLRLAVSGGVAGRGQRRSSAGAGGAQQRRVSVAEAIAIAGTCRSTRNSIAACWRWPAPPAGARPCSRGSPKGALRISTAACSAVEIAGGR